jgi:hypothetical protein
VRAGSEMESESLRNCSERELIETERSGDQGIPMSEKFLVMMI